MDVEERNHKLGPSRESSPLEACCQSEAASSQCSTIEPTHSNKNGNRTHDLVYSRDVLYQLSYLKALREQEIRTLVTCLEADTGSFSLQALESFPERTILRAVRHKEEAVWMFKKEVTTSGRPEGRPLRRHAMCDLKPLPASALPTELTRSKKEREPNP